MRSMNTVLLFFQSQNEPYLIYKTGYSYRLGSFGISIFDIIKRINSFYK